MRIALISDIHANFIALEAVLADIDRQQVEQIICLGDVATLGPQPKEVLARLQSLGCPCVMGNHDDFLLDPDLIAAYTDEPMVVEAINWCAEQLSRAELTFLRAFQSLIEIPMGGPNGLLCYHGSPRSNTEMILATTPDAELEAMLAGHNSAVMAGGHTHVPMLRRHQGAVIVTVGSVGEPFEHVPFEQQPRLLPWAEYSILSWQEGCLSVDLRQVPFELHAFRQAVLASGMPNADRWADMWPVA